MNDSITARMGRKLKSYFALAALTLGEIFRIDTSAKKDYEAAKHQTYGWYGRQKMTYNELRRQAMAWEAGVKRGEVMSKVKRKGIPGVPGRSKVMRAVGCNTKHDIAF